MRVVLDIPDSFASYEDALEALTRVNERILAGAVLSGVEPPSLYESGARYQREPRGVEEWRTVLGVLRHMAGDCEDLAAWRAAELRLAGEPARVVVRRTGRRVVHALVERADGTIEDPSRALGMRVP